MYTDSSYFSSVHAATGELSSVSATEDVDKAMNIAQLVCYTNRIDQDR